MNPVNTEGNAPLPFPWRDLTEIACAGQYHSNEYPHEIEYTLTFDSVTLERVE